MFTQTTPLKYCHWPVAGLEPLAVTATPAKASAEEPPDTWSAASEYCPPNRAATVSPAGLGVSSTMSAALSVPSPATVGASLIAATLIATLSTSLAKPSSVVMVSVSGPLTSGVGA